MGEVFYRISNEYNFNDADKWVQENVIIPMYAENVHGDARNNLDATFFNKYYGISNKKIANEIEDFIIRFHTTDNLKRKTFDIANGNSIEIYGYYSDYDWVLFCSLFGKMIDLPKGFPMYCKDLKQLLDDKASQKIMEVERKYPNQNRFETSLELIKRNPEYPKQQKRTQCFS